MLYPRIPITNRKRETFINRGNDHFLHNEISPVKNNPDKYTKNSRWWIGWKFLTQGPLIGSPGLLTASWIWGAVITHKNSPFYVSLRLMWLYRWCRKHGFMWAKISRTLSSHCAVAWADLGLITAPRRILGWTDHFMEVLERNRQVWICKGDKYPQRHLVHLTFTSSSPGRFCSRVDVSISLSLSEPNMMCAGLSCAGPS